MTVENPWGSKWVQVKPLGNGGQGDTFLVHPIRNSSENEVLKLLRPNRAKDQKSRRRMYHEVSNLRVIKNAGGKVPAIFDDNTSEFANPEIQLYFVMEYVRGRTLAETIQSNGALSVETSVGIALDVCETMAIAFKERILHRDIKPENLMVVSLDPPYVVMVDFGLSFNEDENSTLTETEESLNNKFVTLPERHGPGEDKRDARSDITGICAVLYYCLTGVAPRNLRSSQGERPHRRSGFDLSKTVKNSNQLSVLNLLLDRGFNHEIDLRFQNIKELQDRLKEVLTPNSSEPAEDPHFVIRREAAILRKNDRKTQLEEYRNNLSFLPKIFQQAVQDVAQAHVGQRIFGFGYTGAMYAPDQRTENGDLISTHNINVSSFPHNRDMQVIYRISSAGSECSVHYEIQQTIGNLTTPILEPTLVMRYNAELVPDTAKIVTSIPMAISRAVKELSARIQNGVN